MIVQKIKSIGLWLLLPFLLLLCSGCGQVSPKPPVHITLWHGVNPPSNREVLQRLVDKFNQSQTEVFVEAIYVGQPDQQIPKILAAVVGNAPPDLLWYNPTLTGRLVELDAIAPIDDYLNNSPVAVDLDPALRSTMSLEGHLWSIPFGTNNVALFYRPSLFREAGIKELPRTWRDLEAVAAQLTRDIDGDGKTDRYALLLPLGKGEFTVFIWLPFLWSTGAELLPRLDSPGAIEALTLWQNLVKTGKALLSQPERGYEEENFFAGRVAMQISGSWALRYIASKGIDYGVMPLPYARIPTTVVGGENLFMLKTNPQRQKLAWKFMEYVLSEEFQTEWAIGTGYLPVNLRAQRHPRYQTYLQENPAMGIFLRQMSAGKSRPLVYSYPRLSENLGRAIEQVLLGKQTPAQALAQAQQRLQGTLK
ncbi:MAG: ABC transporter substrate-binding protein [Pseudanabaenaceae cyanobacterium SKYGB_i_bin29]|nr:ABC transporter substrate-binding protein [Pseudanabaenaceae cyanobacterium SKYG29]MDW8421508.1 ABC transporter substrate-binding protein [Pseudanabaenaceae cyanobacterium SKYGB_i_bin29]